MSEKKIVGMNVERGNASPYHMKYKDAMILLAIYCNSPV